VAGQRRSSTIDVNSPEFLSGLQTALGRMKIDGEKGLLRIGLRVQNAARELCPVDTGRLRSSIVHKPGRDGRGPYVEVGTNVAYAAYVEFGTSRQMAQPYLRPALAEVLRYAPGELGAR
jgi:HK97 gp10 family phage protein